MPRPKAVKGKALVGKAPLGSLPEEVAQTAAGSKHDCQVGDIVFWATASAAGEYTVIGHPRGQPNVMVFAGGGEVDTEDCRPTGRSAPQHARQYRMRYLKEHPGALEGSD
jgi:hypothetical protein